MFGPVLEDRRDGSGEGARDDDGEWFSNDLKPSRMVDLDGQRRGLFFSPDMLDDNGCSEEYYCSRLFVTLVPSMDGHTSHNQVTSSMRQFFATGIIFWIGEMSTQRAQMFSNLETY